MQEIVSFGAWVRQQRKLLRLTQEQLARHACCSVVTIRKIEADARRPSVELAQHLARHLALLPAQRATFVRVARGEWGVSRLPLPSATMQFLRFPVPALAPPNLPAPPNRFIGRDVALAQVAAFFRDPACRLLTLVGTGGIGKTRLAIQAAAGQRSQFPDGIYFVSLAPLSDPTLVLNAIARVLGVQERGGQPLSELVQAALRDRQLLLVLDNFEHLLPAAPLVTELLAAAPSLTVLATSREVLHLYGEQEFVVEPLALPDLAHLPPLERLSQLDAVALFLQRARAVRHDFQLSEENAPAVAELCTRLDGLPLAIELAAARVKLFSPQALLTRFERRLQWLTGGGQDRPARQQSLRATIAWSYNLLAAEEQQFLIRLAPFRGGCTVEAAEAVARAEGEALDGLASLVDKSLLRQEVGSDGEPRFTMLETLRDYALEKLLESGEAEAVRSRHLAFLLRLAEEAEPQLQGAQQGQWFNRLEAERDNLRAALDYSLTAGRTQVGLRLAGALHWFWACRGPVSEGRAHLTALLQRTERSEPTTVRAKALTAAADLAYRAADFRAARVLAEESLAVSHALKDAHSIVEALLVWASIPLIEGQQDEERDSLEKGLALAREIGDNRNVALLLNSLGDEAFVRGEYERAAEFYEEALAHFDALGDQWGVSFQLRSLGVIATVRGEYGEARHRLEASLTLDRGLGYEGGIAESLTHLGQIARLEGNYAQASALLAESLPLLHKSGWTRGVARCLAEMAALAAAEGRPARAARLLAASEALIVRTSGRKAYRDVVEYDRIVAATRSQQDEVALAIHWTEGQAMTIEEAVAYGLQRD